MKEDIQQRSFAQSAYERPTEKWVCGWSEDGAPCDHSPSADGRCPIATLEKPPTYCKPKKSDGQFVCTLPRHRGGPCKEGPDTVGTCLHVVQACEPLLSMRFRRARVSRLVSALTIGLLLLVLVSKSTRLAFVDAGRLSSGHRRAIAGLDAEDRCAACHVESSWNVGLTEGLSLSATDTMDDMCLKCHRFEDPASARLAHGVAGDVLEEFALEVGEGKQSAQHGAILRAARSVASREALTGHLACATCHVEHGDDRLTEMTEAQCQICHSVAFDSFASGHPSEFRNYSFEQKTAIKFDHWSHRNHFDSEGRVYDCQACHMLDAAERDMGTQPYETSCRSCHEIRKPDDTVVLVLAPPPGGADIKTIGEWLNDDLEEFPPFMRFLMFDMGAGQEADDLQGSLDSWEDGDEGWEEILTSSVQRLMADLQSPGKFKERLQRIQSRHGNLNDATVDRIAQGLQEALFEYFSTPGQSFDEPVSVGPWRLSDQGIEHLPTHHADGFAQAILEAGAGSATGGEPQYHETALIEIYNEYSSSSSPGRCFLCHDASAGRIQWVSGDDVRTYTRWTKFSHGPHISAVDSCETCHVVNQCYDGKTTFAEMYGAGKAGDNKDEAGCQGRHWNFGAMTKSSCVTCHKDDSSNTGCLECHSYHIGEHTTTVAPSIRDRLLEGKGPA